MPQLMVKKRDGNIQPWDFDKIIVSIAKAGIDMKEAERMATAIQKWAENVAEDGMVSSNDIRDKVVDKLNEVDPIAAQNYEVYKKNE